MSKEIHANDQTWVFYNAQEEIVAAYIPNIALPLFSDDNRNLLQQCLQSIPFTRVMYISKYGKANRTPRYTWAYGQINSNKPNPAFDKDSPEHKYSVLRSFPDPDAKNNKSVVEYRRLDFKSEMMPDWLESLSQYCRLVAVMNWGFDPEYNSVLVARYDDGDDAISFHEDTETFLAHHFCANVTIGRERDFQFKMVNSDGSKQTHEIKLGHKSLFFFLGLEHALPKRAGVKSGEVRYSISFRNMASNVGIGNSFYYCRGLDGAVNNYRKQEYANKLRELQDSN